MLRLAISDAPASCPQGCGLTWAEMTAVMVTSFERSGRWRHFREAASRSIESIYENRQAVHASVTSCTYASQLAAPARSRRVDVRTRKRECTS